MKFFIKSIVALSFFLLVCKPGLSSEILVFKDGKTLEVEDVQVQGNKISFLLYGIKTSVASVDVERIESTNHPANQTASVSRETQIKKNRPSPVTQKSMRPPKNYPAKKRQDPPEKVKPKTRFFRLDGFRELPWGELVSNVSGLQVHESKNSLDGVEEYVRPNEILKIGQAQVETIIYGFWQDRLYTVTIWTKGDSNYRALRQTVFNEFGSGLKPDKAKENYVWSDPKADRMLEYTISNKYGMLWMRSRKLDRQYHLAQLKRPASYLKRIKRDSY